jgi:hypothetical protein
MPERLIEVVYSSGVRVAGSSIWLDPVNRSPFAILTHNLSAPPVDHARTVLHPLALEAHPRRKSHRAFLTANYGERIALGNWDITLLPSGFAPGAAQVLLNSQGRSLLYVGPFSPRPTRVTENWAPVRAEVLCVDLDWVITERHVHKRETEAGRVLAKVRDVVQRGLLPIVFTPPVGLPQELLLAAGPDAPPFLVDDSILRGVSALQQAGFTFQARLVALKQSHYLRGHAILLPENLLPQTARGENRVTIGFRPGAGTDHLFLPFNQPDLADLQGLLEAVQPRAVVYVGQRTDAWAPLVPRPAGVEVSFLDKEAQIGLL